MLQMNIKYCEVWITKGPSSPAQTRSRCLCQLQLPLSEVTTVKMTCKQAPGKLREHLFINFVRKNVPWAPIPLLEKRQAPKWSSGRGLDRRVRGKWTKAETCSKNNSRER